MNEEKLYLTKCLMGGLPWKMPQNLKKETYMKAVKNNGLLLEYIPKEFITEKMCMEAVKNNGLALWYVPKEMITEEMCMEAVKNNGLVLEYVPNKFITEKMCMEAVKNNGLALEYVPNKFISETMCMEAVKNYGLALRFKEMGIPEESITDGMRREIVSRDYDELRDEENLLRYLMKGRLRGPRGYAVREYPVPIEMLTEEMYMEAVKNNPFALEFVPEEMRTEEMYMIAKGTRETEEEEMGFINNDEFSLGDVPKEMLTEEMCMEAIRNNGFALYSVPKEMLTEEMCMEAVKNYGLALIFRDMAIPQELITDEIRSEVAHEDWYQKKLMEETFFNTEDRVNFPYEIFELLTVEICMEAVKNNPYTIGYVPKEMLTEEMCMEAIKLNGRALFAVPEEMITEEMCIEALRNLGKDYQIIQDLEIDSKDSRKKELLTQIEDAIDEGRNLDSEIEEVTSRLPEVDRENGDNRDDE